MNFKIYIQKNKYKIYKMNQILMNNNKQMKFNNKIFKINKIQNKLYKKKLIKKIYQKKKNNKKCQKK